MFGQEKKSLALTNQFETRPAKTEVDALKRLQAGTDDELDALLPTILDKAFKGQL
jgi:hypothetical protein